MAKKLKKNKADDEANSAQDRVELTRKAFEAELYKLQVELTRLQAWAVAEGARVIVVFEGRDTAGKGGVIKRITERCSPRVFKHVALPAPSDREKSQLYIQRYVARFPAAGEIILFDRSWYNRAGVERVMGFCSDEQYEHFLRLAPAVERELVEQRHLPSQILPGRQPGRAAAPVRGADQRSGQALEAEPDGRRIGPPLVGLHAGLSGDDRGDGQAAAPWYIVPADDKRRARLNLIRHLLDQIPYRKVEVDLPKIPKAQPQPKAVEGGLRAAHVVPSRY